MAKPTPKKGPVVKKPGAASASASRKEVIPPAPVLSFLSGFWVQAAIVALLGFGIYANSFRNKYALDDDIVMRLNDYVQQGFDGIGKIMTTDSYDSFFRSMGSAGELQGGRYRPLSIVTFAIEQEVFGETHGNRFIEVKDSIALLSQNPMANAMKLNQLQASRVQLEAQIAQAHENIAMIRHIISVLLYVVSCVVLLWLLRQYLFRYAGLRGIHYTDIAFLAALIFTAHPIHTEVVANVKSRDEILSLLFISLTFIFLFQNEEEKNPKVLAAGLFSYFLALLSKEWGITLVALIPLSLYIFRKYSIQQAFRASLPYFGVALVYIIMRSKFVGAGKQGEITEVLNNPFVFATPIQEVATQIFILVKYLRLLIFPHPLSADYSWMTIPYNNFGDLSVWFSLAVHGAIIYFFFKLLAQRHWIAFAIAFYVSHLFLVSNLAMPIGATMGERLIYHSSVGFIMVASFGILTLITRWKTELSNQKMALAGATILLIVPMSYKTIERNPDWETDNILFMHDAWVVPNSVLANGNSGKAFIEGAQKDTASRQAFLDSAIYHLKKAVDLHPKYVNGYLNLGLAYFQKKDLDQAEYFWNMARKYFPTHPFFRQSYDPALANAFVEEAKNQGKVGNVPKAIEFISRALRYDSLNTETWYHYGGANFTVGNYNEAHRAWSTCLRLNPNHAEARKGLSALVPSTPTASPAPRQ